MYTLLIVDDELQVRQGLKELFDWKALDIEVIGDTANGYEALDLIKTLHPDILVTDVRMNHMDGIELASSARRISPELPIVFISGYADADYLKNALQLKASNYLYKPIRFDELKQTMQGVTEKLRAAQDSLVAQEKMRRLLESSKPLLVERFLRSWFHGLIEDDASICAKLELLGLHFPAQGGLVAVAFQPEWDVFPDDGLAENIQLRLEQQLHKYVKDVLTCAEETGVLTLFHVELPENRSNLIDLLRTIHANLQQELHTRILIGVGSWQKRLQDARQSIQEARSSLDGLQMQQPVHIVLSEQAETPSAISPAFPDNNLLLQYILSGDEEGAWSLIEQSLSKIQNDSHAIRKVLVHTAISIDLTLRHHGIKTTDSLAFANKACGHHLVSTIINAFRSFLRETCRIAPSQKRHYSAVISRVIDIINSRYSEHLSVNLIAEEVHYSSAHLSTLFRKETGVTMSSALLNVRMNASMQQLSNTLLPVSAIARECGFSDVQYFSRAFKQYIGITPLEYRKGHSL